MAYIKRGGSKTTPITTVDPAYVPEPGSPDIGDIAMQVGPIAGKGVSLYNNLQNTKAEKMNLLQNDEFLWKKDMTSLDETYKNIFEWNPENKGLKQFFQKWSKRIRVNPEYKKHRLAQGDSAIEIDNDIKKMLETRDISLEDTNNILYGRQLPKPPPRQSIPVLSEDEFFDEEIVIDEKPMEDFGDWESPEKVETLDTPQEVINTEPVNLPKPGSKENPLTYEEAGITTTPKYGRPQKVDVIDPSKVKKEMFDRFPIEPIPITREVILGQYADEPELRAKKLKAWEDSKNKNLHLERFKKDPNYKPGDLPTYSYEKLSPEAKEIVNTQLFGDEYYDQPHYGKKTTVKGLDKNDPRNRTHKEPGFFKNLGTDKGFFRNIGKGSVKDAWQGSKPGKVVDAFKGIGKGGFKDLLKGSDAAKYGKAIANLGKGGLKSLFAPAKAATATTAATAAGPLAAMGPAGWTMLALSLLGGGGLFKPHTFFGKIFSDPRLKENIEIVGKSPSGINVYEYNYKNVEGRYRGVLANEVPWASSYDKHGHLMVDYSDLDVDFVRVK